MRLDHIAYRVKDRNKTAQFFIDAFGYKIQTEFEINFDDGTTAKCIALEPPEKIKASNALKIPWTDMYVCSPKTWGHTDPLENIKQASAANVELHLPQKFLSVMENRDQLLVNGLNNAMASVASIILLIRLSLFKLRWMNGKKRDMQNSLQNNP